VFSNGDEVGGGPVPTPYTNQAGAKHVSLNGRDIASCSVKCVRYFEYELNALQPSPCIIARHAPFRNGLDLPARV
jgi:hypothetical protein